MTSFVRAAEIWLPNANGTELIFGGGLYGAMEAFREHSLPMRFGRGEGLPGEAWAARHPIVMESFENTTFKRIEAAAAAGLTSGIAMPIFDRDAIKAVVVMFCGDDDDHVGVIEVWKHDPEEDAQIGLHDGYYGGAELFRIASQMTSFGKGFGLPGSVWASDMPIVLRDLYQSSRFLRREEAVKVGLTMALGLPFNYDPGRTWVMVFLSALGTPIAGRFEVWVPAEGDRLVYDRGLSEDGSDDPATDRPVSIGAEQSLLGPVLTSRLPNLTEDCAADAPWLVEPERRSERQSAIAIPTLAADGSLKAVTAWRF